MSTLLSEVSTHGDTVLAMVSFMTARRATATQPWIGRVLRLQWENRETTKRRWVNLQKGVLSLSSILITTTSKFVTDAVSTAGVSSSQNVYPLLVEHQKLTSKQWTTQ